MPPDLALLSTLIRSNYPGLELDFMVPKVFVPLKFDCIKLQGFMENIGYDKLRGKHVLKKSILQKI